MVRFIKFFSDFLGIVSVIFMVLCIWFICFYVVIWILFVCSIIFVLVLGFYMEFIMNVVNLFDYVYFGK